VARSATWEDEWQKTLIEAKKEGEVLLYGGYNPIYREHTALFQKRYPGIQVRYTPGGGTQHATRILSERRAGRFLADMVMGGASTFQVYPQGTFDPIRSLLLLPEVTDKSAWLGGDLSFVDAKGTDVLSAMGSVGERLAYNTKLIDSKAIRAWRDLLDPKWKGKIVRLHRPGSVSDTLLFFYHTPSLGPEFISRLYGETGIVHTENLRQGINWVSEGKFPLYLDGSNQSIVEAKSRGLAIDVISHPFAEGEIISGGYCCMGVLDRRPHPNATRVFINWLLGKESLAAWQKLSGDNSLRMDISKEDVAPEKVPKAGKPYFHVNQAKYHQPKDLDVIRKIIEEAGKGK
jgi:iron(III) transport system substrate-binding protein